jgi:mercuric reductase
VGATYRGLDAVDYLTSTTAMDLAALPESMIVVGGNAVGLEQALLFARLGVKVTVVEALGWLVPVEEPEASAGIEAVFTDEGITVHTGAQLTAVQRNGDRVVTTVGTDIGDHVDCRPDPDRDRSQAGHHRAQP